MSVSVKRISTGTQVVAALPASEDPVEFPAEYFAKNPGKIPVFISTRLDLDKLRQYVYMGLTTGEVNVCHINSYLYRVLQNIEDEARDNWVSFRVTIAAKDTTVRLFDMLEVKEYAGLVPDGKENANLTQTVDEWLPMYILGLQRVGRATDERYRGDLYDHLCAQCKLKSPSFESLGNPADNNYASWINDSNFLKLVAAIDMFFHHFKKHEEAVIRFGTITSRFKDCAALSTMAHLVKVTGMPVEEVMTWVLNKPVEDEVCRMMTPGQEIDKADSYMPYLIDFGLSTKSPYSSVKNPCFHFWGQLTAVLVNSARARNARVPDDIPYQELTQAALLFAYATGRSSDLAQRFVLHNKEYIKAAPDASDNSEREESKEAPTTRDVVEWLAWWDDIGQVRTRDMEVFARRAVHGILDPREKSIGAYARGYFA
ncbi:nucleoprotein [Piry virus]|uniref:Nucleoprotein n=2 Tax=Piry virus TaxID=11274 RepID=NCAP_PIRYV|nr:nucleoprotein [Piry virus]P26037.1 RecName: Full=Nucleoprotein; Short=NP; AltName: Full=Nucleocapsid protein; Short=Protein N [Piry virus]AMR98947.1 nucleoprotein [Piry virus]